MTETFWIFRALVSYWRRHPANLATLIVGLAMATALWSGVQALNAQARDSYRRAAALFGNGAPPSLVAASGGYFAQSVWLDLRRRGVNVSPVLEGSLRINGAAMRIVGVEPLTAPRGSQFTRVAGGGSLADFILAPGRAIVAAETLAELDATQGARLATADGIELPPLELRADAPPGAIFVDIGVAQQLLKRPGQLSRLLVDGPAPAATPDPGLRLEEPSEETDVSQLTDSLHLNLTAFGGLAFLVGLFIVYSAAGLAFQQRLPMWRTMLCVGVSRRALMAAMLIEMLLLALLAGAAGMICGYLIAAFLLPDVSASLEGLYGAQVPGRLSLNAGWWIQGLAMTLVGAFLSTAHSLLRVFHLPAIAVARPVARREALRRTQLWQALAGLLMLAIAAGCVLLGDSLASAFAAAATLMLGGALLLPPIVTLLLGAVEARATGALAQWFWAESRLQLPALSLALMALLLALSTSIGVSAMVANFRVAFLQWLDQRLITDVYLDAADRDASARIEEWLRSRPDVETILPWGRVKIRLAGQPVDLVGARDEATYAGKFPALSFTPDGWDALRRGDGVLASEQLATRLRLSLGDRIDVVTGVGPWRPRIVGVFADYGNPKGQLRTDLDAYMQRWPDAPRNSIGLRVAPDRIASVIADLQQRFGGEIARIFDQASVKHISRGIFEKTFAVTAALDVLTLIVSGVALFTSLSMLAERRVAQLAPAWAIGLPRALLLRLEALRILGFAMAAALAAIPLGVALEWLLVAIVNVRAFGWRLPFDLLPGQWLQALALAGAAAALAALVPLLRLARAQPAELVKVFVNET